MSRMPTIYNAGSLNIDDVFRTSHIVRAGETLPSRSLVRYAGGKGLNQTTALTRAGVRVCHFGRIGDDGMFLKQGLEADGADVSGIVAADEPTGHAIIQVADDGENAIVLFGGANRTWSRTDIDRLLAVARAGDILLLQNEINFLPELMSDAADAGLRLAMNPAPMTPEIVNCPLEKLSWLVVNEIEGHELAGIPLRTAGAADHKPAGDADHKPAGDADHEAEQRGDEEVVAELRSRYPGVVVIMTLGERGAIRSDDSGMIRSCFAALEDIVDTTGAGDSFMGYWLAGEVRGLSAREGLRRACIAGAIAVTRSGATASIPLAEEVERIFHRYI
ncbi:MAG: ribokinase [Salinispira sp.]